jgi:tetratricopeptide (TPR) repeat protein/DNA-binding MarR family transcriptional regulator
MTGLVPLLKHTPSAQKPEVLEAITVQREDLIASLVDCVLDTDGGLRHQLLIGPRGMGKTHILSLVVSRARAAQRDEDLVLAWLDEDPWSIRTYDKFLAAIIARVAEESVDEALAEKARDLRAGDGTRWLEGEEALREALGSRRLVLFVENLEEVFRRIGAEGQAKFRAFAEDWRQLLILATSPQLFEGVRDHASPFYGFFAITHLDELSLDNALELMKRIARLQGDPELLDYLGTDVARRRLAAVEALAGGHPRIWLLLAGCVSIRAIDALVPLFLEALDELTPYYQDRLRELGDQQQELVVLLAEAGGALSNRELAQRSGIAQNQVATMLRHLADRGYVRRAELPEDLAVGDSRLSYWELQEPLMRLCLDVKQARSEPLRMVVEFLRAWYGPRLLDELMKLPPEAKLAATYAREAFRRLDEILPAADLFRGSSEEILARAELGLSVSPGRVDLLYARMTTFLQDRQLPQAKSELEELISTVGPQDALEARMLFVRHALGEVDEAEFVAGLTDLVEHNVADVEVATMVVNAFVETGHYEEALGPSSKAIELLPSDAGARARYGAVLQGLNRNEEALEAFRDALELDPENSFALVRESVLLHDLGRSAEALVPLQHAAELDPANAWVQIALGQAHAALGRWDEAEVALGRAAELRPSNPRIHVARGLASRDLFDMAEAFARAAEIEPEAADFQALLAMVLRFLGKFEEAEPVARRAVELKEDQPEYRFLLAEIVIAEGDFQRGLDLLLEALAAWQQEDQDGPAGNLHLLFPELLERSPGKDWRELFAGLVEAYREVDAAEDLGQGIVAAIPKLASEEINLERAEVWVDDWLSTPAGDELRIPFALVQAALGWKRDRDRSHLLALPPEQREILIELLEEDEG